ncbi:peptidase M28 family protein [Flavobacterium amnicola]|uniref:Carboxypeptidase Q n=1 Tax=Flavobacterium amnicola TaxID=2506422 RepID=A0A4Q1K358_9FLAO|nr:M28 family peptidase [Flavobacterium amnicola]RXR19177.1 peptidase M28 family protein [Flavobacterium amnicola]
MKKLPFLLVFTSFLGFAQSSDEEQLKAIYHQSLTNSKCYSWLDYLSNTIGHRLSGSVGAEKAVQYTKAQMEASGTFDKVYLQEVMVPKWVRGEKESAYILDGKKKVAVPICALGGSVATPKKGILAEVVEVKSLKELETLGEAKLTGKIIFFNRPMNPENVQAFLSYRDAGDQRRSGAKESLKYGALGVIVRSLTFTLDDFPHTGNTNYGDVSIDKRIPACAISTNGANLLSQMLKQNPTLKFYFKQSCYQEADVLSHNVIGEIKGTSTPENIIVVGGHLDSWDLADGSHDDGAGCVQSMEVANIFKNIGYKPKNTIRVVLFMNEENGGRGGDKYQELAQKNNENHIFAMESDSGGFVPRGFSIEGTDANLAKISSFKNLFEPYFIHSFTAGHGGSDIEPLTSPKLVKAGLRPDSQRYFDYHHAGNDKFDAINKRELELGAATMTALIYLIDTHGI